jgi:hypothetical protein
MVGNLVVCDSMVSGIRQTITEDGLIYSVWRSAPAVPDFPNREPRATTYRSLTPPCLRAILLSSQEYPQ